MYTERSASSATVAVVPCKRDVDTFSDKGSEIGENNFADVIFPGERTESVQAAPATTDAVVENQQQQQQLADMDLAQAIAEHRRLVSGERRMRIRCGMRIVLFLGAITIAIVTGVTNSR